MPESVSNSNPYIADRDRYKNKKEFSSNLDQNSFMKLMIEQLKNQDPMSPMDNSQFLQQTSMMTMVERLTRMQTLMEESNSSLLNIREYESLVGKTATYDFIRKTDDGEETKETKTGVISGVRMEKGKILFNIGDNQNIPRDYVHGLESKGMSNDTLLDNTLQYSDMIGKQITFKEPREVDKDGNPETKNDITTVYDEKASVITGLSLKNGKLQFQIDNGQTISLDQLSGISIKPDNLPMDNTLKYTQLIGYKVTYLQSSVGSDGKTTDEERTGTVKAVSMKNGLVELLLDNEAKLKPNQIIGLEAANKSNIINQ